MPQCFAHDPVDTFLNLRPFLAKLVSNRLVGLERLNLGI